MEGPMTKAPRQPTPIPKPLRKLANELRKPGKSPKSRALRKLAADLGKSPKSPASETMRTMTANSDKLNEFAEHWNQQWQESQKQTEEQRKFREFIDDAISGRALAREIVRELNKSNAKSIGTVTAKAWLTTEPVTTKAWVTAEVVKMKKDKEIPEDIRKSDLARLLEVRMRTAAKTNESLRPVGAGHIRNELSGWGLWPVTAVKIS